ncbi:MAG: GFA family protein [Deltaproteobacteria bacterium]|nr:MAG: GFA family protein [Deltaproteobacteria bacterium]
MEERGVTGSCLCGEVQLRVRMPTLGCVHCHCTMCQRNHGAGYVTWVAVPRQQVEVTSGADRLVVYRSSEHGTRSFCGRCGSSLLCDIALHPNQIDVAHACLHGPIDREPQLHIYFDDRATWTAVGDDLPRLGGKTGLEPIR